VPFAVKDNIDVAGMPTTAACPAFSYRPEHSARSVELLLEAGAVCLGKTNLDQFTPFQDAGRMLFDGPWIAERHAALSPFLDVHRDDLLDVTRSILRTADRYSAGAAFAGMHRLGRMRRAVAQQFAAIEALVVPTAPRPYTIAEMIADPIRLNNRLGHYSYFANLLDLCAIAVPNGVLACGVAMGVTMLAPAWADERLAALARRFEDKHSQAPPAWPPSVPEPPIGG
jgi:amidase/allophanate hydrolase